ncbi:NAD(P)-dependent dehydrogenase (short-subunit alcohol dehydrogenase family) [Paenarthrobacter sp. A20]|nr:NAD(P)-dependent dehydrogenase (short-subunit alcohol dehydrogenase family) [Paenarthrobacter sp. A20]
MPGDLKNPATCQGVVDTAVAVLGGVDILVTNAGKQVARGKPADITDEQFDHTLKTNVYAMFWLTKAALPHLPVGSTIISINNFTKGLARQLAPQGIRVNAVAPGPRSGRRLPVWRWTQ